MLTNTNHHDRNMALDGAAANHPVVNGQISTITLLDEDCASSVLFTTCCDTHFPSIDAADPDRRPCSNNPHIVKARFVLGDNLAKYRLDQDLEYPAEDILRENWRGLHVINPPNDGSQTFCAEVSIHTSPRGPRPVYSHYGAAVVKLDLPVNTTLGDLFDWAIREPL